MAAKQVCAREPMARPAMTYRTLGNTGVRVSALGLGCSSLGGGVFYRNDAESLDVLARAFERGVTFYDTADTYGYGYVERLIGLAFRSRRRDVVIASKVGFLPSSLARIGKAIVPLLDPIRPLLQPLKVPLHRASTKRQDFSADHMRRALEGSLRRLQTDYLDLYLLHNPPAQVIQRGEVFEWLDRFKREGGIRWYGVSASTIDDALLALDQPGVAAVEVAFNVLQPEAAASVLPRAARQGVGVIARVPLARGLLTDRAALLTGAGHVDAERLAQMRARREPLASLTRDGRRTMVHAALQFVLQHPEVSTAIPGTRSVSHLEENLRALSAPPLTPADLTRLS